MPSHLPAAALTTVLLLSACGADSQPDPATPEGSTGRATSPAAGETATAAPPRDPMTAVLVDLRARLDRVRGAAADALVTEDPVDAAALVGAHRDMVVRALGEPHACGVENGAPTPAPCEHETDVFYSFYHLPEGSVGGGPEMLIRYEGDRVSQVLWRFTQ